VDGGRGARDEGVHRRSALRTGALAAALGACAGAAALAAGAGATTAATAARPRTAEGTAVCAQAPLATPTAARPLTLLVIGDSLGEDLESGLAAILSPVAHVRLVEAAVGSSGLDEPQYYDWPAHLANALARDRPSVVVVLLGANDTLSFYQGGRYAAFGSALWRRDYGGRVARLLREARRARARVLWVGLPVMASWSVLANANVERLNALYAAQARHVCGATYLSTWGLFQAPGGGFATELRSPGGAELTVRDPDGVHIAPMAGDELVATAVLAALDRRDGLHLCPTVDDPWRRLAAGACRRRRAGSSHTGTARSVRPTRRW
jgi:hypothetical protein